VGFHWASAPARGERNTPPNIASSFTVGQQAVLRIVADEYLAHGACDRSRNELASRAGVSLTVVKQAIKLAELDHSLVTVQRRPRSGRKHLTNIIRVVRAEWKAWLAKGRRRPYATAACNRAKPIFEVRQVHFSTPRSQRSRTIGIDRVDKPGREEKGRRSAPSFARGAALLTEKPKERPLS
jgi:hypothetical protein